MKKFLAFILMLVMVMSFSVCAFAADASDASPMPKDVSIEGNEDGKIQLGSLSDLPDPLKDAASKQIEIVIGMGYKIHSGFGVWSEDAEKTFCTVKLSKKDVPDGAVIFVNGAPIQPETKDDDGYFYFEVSLDSKLDKSVVLIAVPEKKAGSGDGSGSSSSGGKLHYNSPSFS